MTFGLVIQDNSNPFLAELARSIEEVGFEHGYTMLLGNAMFAALAVTRLIENRTGWSIKMFVRTARRSGRLRPGP